MSFNPETNSNCRPVEKSIAFMVREHAFRFVLSVPEYIVRALNSADWDLLNRDLTTRATDLLTQAARIRLIGERARLAVAPLVEIFAGQRLYEIFSEAQRRAGNDAWEVPESLAADAAVTRSTLAL